MIKFQHDVNDCPICYRNKKKLNKPMTPLIEQLNLGEMANYTARMRELLKQALWELENHTENKYTNAAIANILKELEDIEKGGPLL